MTTRTALVTGASRGIGLACAKALAKAGNKVVLAARNLEKLEAAAASIREEGGQALAITIDLSSPESIQESIKKAIAEAGPIHILVNNAGVTKDGLSMRMKMDDWNQVIQTNLTGAFVAAQAVMSGMMKERWGRIINIASVVGEMGNPGQANYVASKAGLIGLTKSLAQELASRNITVNAVTPGFIETDMTAVLSDEQKERITSLIPLKRLGQADDIAAAVAFLASDNASYITGHILKVNGGMYM
ncbi:3-oxoacyl-[acyl-carrier-protein] reductase [Bryobacter aggregatus]|uniref:3-oxoacyl-[acyl-carrier-protein] reductase n=1 Tax=Bryobacter aggregatus TaxID=360054 RepID=UPI0004E0BE31|nr:3-oxoacyl-[acyl-carrier-protein] reductase [Bryobacter aggregatus]